MMLVMRAPALLFHPLQMLLRRSPLPSAGVGSEETGTASIDALSLTPELTGRTLGSCRIDHKLGQGCMGQVYKGHHPMLDRPVAIKILPPALAESEERRARFRQEARIAAALRHPGIVQIYDLGEAAGTMVLIMEYIDGESLKARMTRLRTSGEATFIHWASCFKRWSPVARLSRPIRSWRRCGSRPTCRRAHRASWRLTYPRNWRPSFSAPWPSNQTIASAVLKSWQTPSAPLRP